MCACARERSAACRRLRSELRPDCGSERGGARGLGAAARFLLKGLRCVGGPEGRGPGVSSSLLREQRRVPVSASQRPLPTHPIAGSWGLALVLSPAPSK